MIPRALGISVIVTAAVSLHATAQNGQTCFVDVDSTGGVGRQVDIGGGYVRWYQGGGIWAHCRGEPTVWYSDSIAWYQDLNRFEMIGNVDFRDATAQLDSDRATYFLLDERLEAYGNAQLQNLETGSVLRGPNLTYWRAVPGIRDTTELYANRRPTIEYRSANDSAGAEHYLIVADQVRFLGNTAATAWGSVTIDRSDFAARSDSATLDTEVGAGVLVRNAHVAGGDSSDYTLEGREIKYRLTERQLSWVQAEGEADATSDEWRIIADTIQFDLVDNRMDGGNAWGDSLRPMARSTSHTITADSLVIEAPGQELSTVRGIGTALAMSKEDSLDTEGDWMAGDTVVARFDTTETGQRVLSRLEAEGDAQAHYRVYPDDDRTVTPDISYSRGARIVATFADERVRRVDVVGKTDGVYLEARRRGQK